MAARDELQAEFAFTDAALAGKQNAHAEYIHEDAVHGTARCKELNDIVTDKCQNLFRRLGGPEDRQIGIDQRLNHVVRKRQVQTNNQT